MANTFSALRTARAVATFFRREGPTLLASLACGAAAAFGFEYLVARGARHQVSLWYSALQRDNVVPYLIIALIFVGAWLLLHLVPTALRAARSWCAGVVSGLGFLPFLYTSLILVQAWPTPKKLILVATATLVCLFAALLVACLASKSTEVTETQLQRLAISRSRNALPTSFTDDPITDWTQDVADRGPFVQSVATYILTARPPVVALYGPLGSGKTSVFNLLRSQVDNLAIVITFSTWLPGSPDGLIAGLLQDIATEIKKRYVLPGLRRQTQRLAKVLAYSVPSLRGIVELVPAATQADEIAAFAAFLRRVPQRVVILIDDVDRMNPDELQALLKLIRGLPLAIPNLTLVCATDRNAFEQLLPGDSPQGRRLFGEKFFPIVFRLPAMDPSQLKDLLISRLIGVFQQGAWDDLDGVRKKLEELWSRAIEPWCRTLRATGVLVNDVASAASPLCREVDAVDLTLITLLHRFEPDVYEVLRVNPDALTGGESVIRGGSYHSDEQLAEMTKGTSEAIKRAAILIDAVGAVVQYLFPRLAEPSGRRSIFARMAEEADPDEGRRARRISNPGMFATYFRGKVPDAIYGRRELEKFIRRFERAKDRQHVFAEELASMEKGGLRRDSFLAKLSSETETLDLSVSESIVKAAMGAADALTYDIIPTVAEAGYVLRALQHVTERMEHANRAGFLSQCISIASDDSMAFRIFRSLGGEHRDGNLGVSLAELYPAFLRRMRGRYGPGVNAATCDLSTADREAFAFWGSTTIGSLGLEVDPVNASMQRDFWLRYVGADRSRLLYAFEGFFLPRRVIFEKDPTPYVEQMIPVEDLKRLNADLARSTAQLPEQRIAQDRLDRFLNGEFKDGISIGDL